MSDEIKIGDYVMATKYSDGSPKDRWSIGLIAAIDDDRYMISHENGELINVLGHRRCEKITKNEGDHLLEVGDELEKTCHSGFNLYEYLRDYRIDQLRAELTEKDKRLVSMAAAAKKLANDCRECEPYGTDYAYACLRRSLNRVDKQVEKLLKGKA